ncbi:5'-nucleotidase C-terminal domain-containing protein [Streptomyces sp. NPDC008121]|uniref:5'-nucleotidase C-terminal domain-containing protein n=1 Tax=Streptomyces sp. NPDC008121 TaxID=3364809 RepID=UPI0036E7F16A
MINASLWRGASALAVLSLLLAPAAAARPGAGQPGPAPDSRTPVPLLALDVPQGVLSPVAEPFGRIAPRGPAVPTGGPARTAPLSETWRTRSEDVAGRVVGHISDDLPGRGSTRPETPLGSLIADGQAAAGRRYGADLALLNPDAMRADLVYHDGGVVTYADAHQVHPFETPLHVLPVTGARLVTALRQQFTGENAASPRFLQLSKELTYAVDMSRSGGDRLLADTVRIHGRPVTPEAVYKVVLDELLADGGNGFTVFAEITTREGGETTDLAALVAHLEATTSPAAPATPSRPGRITFTAR